MTQNAGHHHEGRCRLGLGFRAHGQEYDAAFLLREAINWGTGLDDLTDEVDAAFGVLVRWDRQPHPASRPWPFADLHLDVTPEEIEAIRTLLREALDYWDRNDYANTDGTEEDVWLGTCGPSMAATLRMCGIEMWGDKAARATRED